MRSLAPGRSMLSKTLVPGGPFKRSEAAYLVANPHPVLPAPTDATRGHVSDQVVTSQMCRARLTDARFTSQVRGSRGGHGHVSDEEITFHRGGEVCERVSPEGVEHWPGRQSPPWHPSRPRLKGGEVSEGVRSRERVRSQKRVSADLESKALHGTHHIDVLAFDALL
eukprot:2679369-Rhodomonas_salina.1